jgi:DNA mismatch endonuclease, patch repair protein
MTDHVGKDKRSRIMRSVKSKNSGPEMVLRRSLHRLGFRYRIHCADLPGKPDIVFTKRKKIIFVHGCFWHGHGCGKGRLPKSNVEFWRDKIERNIVRDAAAREHLENAGWKVLTVWQCELRDPSFVQDKVLSFLNEA